MTIPKIVARPVLASGPVSTGAEIAAAVNAIIDAYHAFQDVGWSILDSFEVGATVNLRNELLRWGATGGLYRWDGPLPKAVASGGTPASRGGVGSGGWLMVDLNGESIANQIFGKATLDLDFTKNIHKVYEPFGLTNKVLTDAVTTVRDSTATYDTPTSISTAAVNIPRIEYDGATGNALGLLAEDQRTNLFLHSEDFANAAWLQSPNADVNVTSDVIVGPNNGMTGDKFFEATTANTFRDLYQNISYTAGVTYCFSIYVKAGERTKAAFFFGATGAFTTERRVTVDFVSKTVTVGGLGATGGIQEQPNGWFRVWICGTADVTGVTPTIIRLLDNAGTTIYPGVVNSGFFIYGAQVEVGSFPTSYIPTAAAQNTRVADVISRALTVKNANAGSIFIEFNFTDYNKIGNTTIVSLNGSPQTSERGFALTVENNLVQAMIRNASGARSASIGVVNSLQPMKVLVSFDNIALKIIIAVNGVASEQLNPSAVDISAFVSHLYIAGGFRIAGGVSTHSKTVKRCSYFPRSMTVAEAQAITT